MSHKNHPFDIAITAIAPLVWGSTYLVTTEFLPPDRPFLAAVLRCLPAGLLLLLWTRQFPKRHEWSKVVVLAFLNIGFFSSHALCVGIPFGRRTGGDIKLHTSLDGADIGCFYWQTNS